MSNGNKTGRAGFPGPDTGLISSSVGFFLSTPDAVVNKDFIISFFFLLFEGDANIFEEPLVRPPSLQPVVKRPCRSFDSKANGDFAR